MNRPHSDETKLRLRQIGLSRAAIDPAAFSEQMASLRRGKKMPPEAVERIRAFQKTKVFSPETRRKISEAKRGHRHPLWKGDAVAAQHIARRQFMNTRPYKEWRRHVFQRDDYTCQACGQRGGKLHADHILPFADFPDTRLEILNGQTLCAPCHRRTPSYGLNSRYHLSPYGQAGIPTSGRL